jgi:hypothetical protein
MGKVSNNNDTVGCCGVRLKAEAAEWNEADEADSLGLCGGRDEHDVERSADA